MMFHVKSISKLRSDLSRYLEWIRVGQALCDESPSPFIVWMALSAKQDHFDCSSIDDL